MSRKDNHGQTQMPHNGSENDVKINPPGMSEWNVYPDEASATEMTTSPTICVSLSQSDA